MQFQLLNAHLLENILPVDRLPTWVSKYLNFKKKKFFCKIL